MNTFLEPQEKLFLCIPLKKATQSDQLISLFIGSTEPLISCLTHREANRAPTLLNSQCLLAVIGSMCK